MDKTCFRYQKGHVGFPCIAGLNHDECVVADWTGHLTVLDLIAKRELARVFVGAMEGHACCTLCSLSASRAPSSAACDT